MRKVPRFEVSAKTVCARFRENRSSHRQTEGAKSYSGDLWRAERLGFAISLTVSKRQPFHFFILCDKLERWIVLYEIFILADDML